MTVITHVPLLGQGTRQAKAYDLHFTRHDTPPPLYINPSTSSSSTITLTPANTTTIVDRTPSCSYTLALPNYPIGPEDAVPSTLR